ncbi:hypothetical protein Tco_0916635 [Tanacetum coccineum]
MKMEILLEPTSNKLLVGYLKDGDGDGNSQPHKGVKASANSDVMYFFTSAQDGDPSQDDVRLCLGDDLKKAQDHIKPSTSASGPQPSSNTKKDMILQTQSSTQKNKVEVHPRQVKSSLKNKDHVVAPKGTAHVQHSKLNANYELKCVKCNGCMLSDNHDLCVLDYINNVNARAKSKSAKKQRKRKVVQIVLWYLDSGCSKHMTGDRSQLTNFVNKFLGTVKFGNDHVAKILGYGDYYGNVTISRVYYVEGLGHNLFSVRQFCDSNLEVAFRQYTCFIRNLEGGDLLTGS